MIYPWQQPQWQQLLRIKQDDRLPHALLFAGLAGTGKAKFAEDFSRMLLCQQFSPEGEYCGSCHACRLITGRTHPNLLWIEPEKEGALIKVDQVRAVLEFVQQSALQGEYRIVIVNPAQNMNINAANALLKTLEEPTPNAILLLVCDEIDRLPATILSRCQRILFPRPDKQEALQWLAPQMQDAPVSPDLLLNIANGAPLAALNFLKADTLTMRRELFETLSLLSQNHADPLKSAAKLQDNDLLWVLDFTLSWMADLLKLQLDGDGDAILNIDFKSALEALKQQTELHHNLKYMEYLQKLRIQTCQGINLNKQLALESMLLGWIKATNVMRESI